MFTLPAPVYKHRINVYGLVITSTYYLEKIDDLLDTALQQNLGDSDPDIRLETIIMSRLNPYSPLHDDIIRSYYYYYMCK